ncbi:MAG: T9SS type A sorting domain-containing protein [Saprospiraceae bacterium]|nr:T9SS type A sorting domain-containing protein [Saprospiraceae bacterium]
MRLLLVSIIFLTFSMMLLAQPPSDCFTALDVCLLDTSHIEYHRLQGVHTESNSNQCIPAFNMDYLELNTIWLKYIFNRKGRLLFTIEPVEPLTDIDFTVFRSANGSCTNLESIRCMFSGETIGGEIDSVCLGPTGLSEEATDTIEFAGCHAGDDNFLSPVDVQKGDVIFLAITSFSPDSRFAVNFHSNAELSCATSSFLVTKENRLSIFPNPATDYFNIGGRINPGNVREMAICDLSGRIIWDQRYYSHRVNISSLKPGLYLVHLRFRHAPPATFYFTKIAP